MNLTPEQRDIGKQNFQAAVGTTRREFLQGTLAAGAIGAGSLGAMYFGYGAKMDDPLRIGIIGTGDEGSVLIGALNPAYFPAWWREAVVGLSMSARSRAMQPGRTWRFIMPPRLM